MTGSTEESRIVTARMDSSAMECIVTVQPGTLQIAELESQCEIAVSEIGIEYTGTLRSMIESALHTRGEASDHVVHIELRGRQEVHGEPGRFEWDCSVDPAQRGRAELTPQGGVDHYSRSKYICVQAGKVLGRVLPPTDGEDGQDLLGRILHAKPGQPVAIQHDESIVTLGDGTLIAQVDGVLEQHGQRLSIQEELHIKGCIDFSTGNIDFSGTVIVDGGVKDNFKVVVRDDLQVGGVIDAADITVGRDLLVKSGISGKERANIHVGRNLRARYASQTSLRVGRDAVIEREILNCDAHIGGSCAVLAGGIVGGSVHVLGAMKTQFLGSEASVPTVIHLGSSPAGARHLRRVHAQREVYEQEIAVLEQTLLQIQQRGPRMSAFDREAFTEAQCAQIGLADKLQHLDDLYGRLAEAYYSLRVVDLRVERLIHPGVRLQVGKVQAIFKAGIRGPVRIFCDEQNQLLISERDAPASSLSTVAILQELGKVAA